MNILLINPAVGYFTRASFNPLGLIAIGSYLTKKLGENVRLFDRCVEREDIGSVIEQFKPDLIGVSLMSSRGLKDALKVSKIAKKRNIPVIWGGAMPTMQPELVLDTSCVDYVILGEGEYVFEELLEALRGEREIDQISGIAYLKDGKFTRTQDRPFADLADFPVTDWSLIHPEKYMKPYIGCNKLMYLYSAKGCPCNCAFCPNPAFHKSTFRKRPNEYVIEEIKYLIENYGMDGVFFSDELWCMRRSDMLDFCRRVKENDLHFTWMIQVRVGQFTREDYQIMYDAGCRMALFGVESGSREILKRIHKNIDYNKIIPTFQELREIGITTTASFIIGYPGETADQLRETVALLKSISANLTPINHFTPLPGTELYREVVKEGKYKEAKSLKELSKVIATESVGQNLSAVPTTDLRVIRSWFEWKTFTRKDAVEGDKPFKFAIDTILSGLKSISQKGPIFFFVDGFKAFKEFIYVFWYSHAYPSVRKKYDLK